MIEPVMHTPPTIIKGEHRFTFRYEVGYEFLCLDAIVDAVRQNIGLDWFDASILAHSLGTEATRVLKNYAPEP